MSQLDPTMISVDARFEAAGFGHRTLESFEFPEIQHIDAHDGSQLATVTFGDIHEAPRVVSIATPYATELASPHFLLRLSGIQTALGEDYAVLGSQVFHPKDQPLTDIQRLLVSEGDFGPFAERQIAVIEQQKLKDHQQVIAHGQSMAADIAIELAYSNRFNGNRGCVPLVGVGVIEPARMMDRRLGGLGMLAAFARSGGDLAANVVASDVPALNEAWNVPVEASLSTARKVINKQVNKDVRKYATANLEDNWALARGFATRYSADELTVLLAQKQPVITVVRSSNSVVFPKKVYDELKRRYPASVFEAGGDHSLDNNLRKAAYWAVMAANRAV